ncbi:MAG: hypothetical protein EA415_12940 [Sphaerobacteraceae bacterium]|nr:MAG: hypothetical protein EA415_12940 [Sphaerobacteraceae bacterium]
MLQLVSDVEQRFCPDCGSGNVDFTQRGYAGKTDERHQFYRCYDCDRLTYEILSRNVREMKMERLETGQIIEEDGHLYRVMRILKIGIDEHLIYVRAENDARAEMRKSRRRH